MPTHPRVAALIPSYNNACTLGGVLEGVLAHLESILVIDDGSTDQTSGVLEGFVGRVCVHRHPHNQGKGVALLDGFRLLREQGFTHALTLDADGQHFPDDIPTFLEAVRREPSALLIGQRDMKAAGAPRRSRFGLWCSNLAFARLAGTRLDDSQAGFRAYPLNEVGSLDLRGRRYDLELEVLIKAAWRGIPITPLRIDVTYAPEHGRVSHFRPVRDFLRIGWMVLGLLRDRPPRS